MKRLFLLLIAALLVGAGTITAQEVNSREDAKAARQAAKEARQKAKEAEKAAAEAEEKALFEEAKAALEAQDFVLEADRVEFKRGNWAYVTPSTNFVSLIDGKATVQLAFNGAFSGPNGIGGITVEGTPSNISLKTDKKGNVLIKSDDRITFNFSAIAKGMGCDEVGKMLERNGVTDYIVEIGGEITAKGHNPKGQKWRISIDKPINANDTVIHHSAGIVEITNCGIATSGNYRNYHTDSAGNKVAHTINPRTGMPEQSDVLSATVIAPDCMTADAYATTFMVLGLEKSKKLLDKHPEISAMLITSDNGNSFKIWESDNFPKMQQH